eukprot:jgi/Chlat1/9035/Chrsp94S08301
MLVEVTAFGEDGFSPRAWVNHIAAAKPADEPLERYLSEIEMKVQLVAEEVGLSLEDISAHSLVRVPRAHQHASRLAHDAQALRTHLASILNHFQQVETVSSASVQALASLDRVKQRMESARDTLQEAAGLAELSAKVETVFAKGDLPQVADVLASMRRCLAVLGDVPEFADGQKRLQALEQRLESMLEPRLVQVLTDRNEKESASLAAILLRVGRVTALERHYTRARSQAPLKLWEAFGNKPGKDGDEVGSPSRFATWLPGLYDEVLSLVEREIRWCSSVFPDLCMQLVSQLLTKLFDSIAGPFSQRIDDALAAIDGFSRQTPLGLLLALHSTTAAFERNLQPDLQQCSREQLKGCVRVVYLAYEPHKQQYGELERQQLLHDVATVDLTEAEEVADTVAKMEASIPVVTAALERAVDRCVTFTWGTESEALLRALDEAAVKYLAAMLDLLRSLRVSCGLQPPPPPTQQASKQSTSSRPATPVLGGNVTADASTARDDGMRSNDIHELDGEQEWGYVQGALQLLSLASTLSTSMAVFEANVCNTMKELHGKLRPTESGITQGPVDPAQLRLADSPDRARRLFALLDQAQNARLQALPHAAGRVVAFQEAAHAFVYDALVHKVRGRVAAVPTMPVWREQEGDNAFDLPSFSAYPLPYITFIGEYLLTLPQQLEPLQGNDAPGAYEATEESLHFASEWMFRVAEGAVGLYVDQLMKIAELSDKGAVQLATDIEYLSNVLAALSVSTPPSLASFRAAAAASKEELASLAKGSSNATLDARVVSAVAKMRGV